MPHIRNTESCAAQIPHPGKADLEGRRNRVWKRTSLHGAEIEIAAVPAAVVKEMPVRSKDTCANDNNAFFVFFQSTRCWDLLVIELVRPAVE